MDVAEAVARLKAAAEKRFDQLTPNERELYHRESWAIGYAFGIIEHVKYERRHHDRETA